MRVCLCACVPVCVSAYVAVRACLCARLVGAGVCAMCACESVHASICMYMRVHVFSTTIRSYISAKVLGICGVQVRVILVHCLTRY